MGIKTNGDLMRYRFHPTTWAHQRTDKIGAGWNIFSHVIGGKDGLIYAVEASTGKIRYYRDTFVNSTSTWAPNVGKVVGSGFSMYEWILGGEDGIIYAIDSKGDLLIFKDSKRDGTGTIAKLNKIGSGWNMFSRVVGGAGGVLWGEMD